MAADLFGLEQTQPRKNERKEAAALVDVLQALRTHAAVAWVRAHEFGCRADGCPVRAVRLAGLP